MDVAELSGGQVRRRHFRLLSWRNACEDVAAKEREDKSCWIVDVVELTSLDNLLSE